MATTAQSRGRRPWESASERVDLSTVAFALIVLAGSALILHLTRGTTLWFDEWKWAIERRAWNPDAFLEPHNGHLSVAPVLVFKTLYSTVGLEPYLPYRLALVGCNALLCWLVFVYLRRRVGSYLAMLGGTLLVVLGPGWQDLLWAFQIGFQLSLVGGVGALVLLDHGTRRADVGAAAMLGLALASSGIGVPVALGVALVIVLERRRWTQLWILAAPGALYAAWWLAYYNQDVQSAVGEAPGYVFDSASATVAGLLGTTGSPLKTGLLLSVGRPLLIVILVLAVWRCVRLGRVPSRVIAVTAIPVSFWALTVVSRGGFAVATSSRYLHVGAVFVVLAAGDLLRGARIPRWALVAVGAVALASTVSHLHAMREAGVYLRGQTEATRGSLAAADLAGNQFARNTVLQGLPGADFVAVPIQDYFAVRDDLGSPAYDPARLASAPAVTRRTADLELRAGLRVRLTRASRTRPGRVRCLTTRLLGGSAGRALEVPRNGVTVRDVGGDAAVGARRFGDDPAPIGAMRRGATYSFAPPRDGSGTPWRLQVKGRGQLTVCPR